MNDQFGVSYELQEFLRNRFENWLVAEEVIAQTVHFKCLLRHCTFWIDVLVVCPSGGHMIEQFHAADFYDAITFVRIKTGRFRVHYNLTHSSAP